MMGYVWRFVEGVGVGAGYVGAAVFILLMFAGGIYRTECTLDNGRHLSGWGLQGDIPYLWDPGEGCEAHTLTRYLSGKVGLQEELPE